MDLSKIKQKLQELNSETNRVNAADVFWRPDFGESTIRIVPSKFDKDNPFTELYFHNVLDKYPVLALSNFGEQDPVIQLIEQLRMTSDKENWSLSGKLSPRPRYFVPIIVRGEEDKGVRLWSIGPTIYKALLQLAADPEIGDFTDIAEGCDMKINKVQAQPYPETTIRAARSNSPLSDDPKLIEKWLKEQPDPKESFRKPTFDKLKQLLAAYLSPGSSAQTNTQKAEAAAQAGVEKVKAQQEAYASEPPSRKVVTVSEATEKGTQVGDVIIAKNPAPKDGEDKVEIPEQRTRAKKPASPASKFADLFGDDEDDKPKDEQNEKDDLPF